MWKFYEIQLILSISSTSVVFTLFPSVFFSLASLLYMFFSFLSLLLSVVQSIRGTEEVSVGSWTRYFLWLGSFPCTSWDSGQWIVLTVLATSQCCCWAELCLESISDIRYQLWKSFLWWEHSRAMTAWETWMTEESSAATQVASCKFRSQFPAKTMTFNVVRMGEEFLKRSDPRKPLDHKN